MRCGRLPRQLLVVTVQLRLAQQQLQCPARLQSHLQRPFLLLSRPSHLWLLRQHLRQLHRRRHHAPHHHPWFKKSLLQLMHSLT